MASPALPRNARHDKPRSAALARQAPSAGTPGKIILSHRYKGPGEGQNTTCGVAGRSAPQAKPQGSAIEQTAVFGFAARGMSGGVHVRSFRGLSNETRTLSAPPI